MIATQYFTDLGIKGTEPVKASEERDNENSKDWQVYWAVPASATPKSNESYRPSPKRDELGRFQAKTVLYSNAISSGGKEKEKKEFVYTFYSKKASNENTASSLDFKQGSYIDTIFITWQHKTTEALMTYSTENNDWLKRSIQTTETYLRALRSSQSHRLFLATFLLILKSNLKRYDEARVEKLAKLIDKQEFKGLDNTQSQQLIGQIKGLGLAVI